MNVGVVTAHHEPIGFNYGVLGFCRHAPALGVNATVIAMTRHPHRDNRFIEEARRLGLPIENLHERYRYDPRVFGGLVDIADRLDLDLLDVQTYKPLVMGLYARRARPRLGVISWVHGFTRENLKIRLFGMAERRLHRFADKTICVSGPFSEMLFRRGMRRDKVAVVPNAIEEEPSIAEGADALRREIGLASGIPVVGAIGRLSPEKGHAFLLRAWVHVSRSVPSARLVLVGDGPCMRPLKEEAERLGLGDSVMFAGFHPNGKRFFGLFDVMVLPSLEEGLPYVLLESMISKVPVVASKVGEVPAVLQNGRLGRLVEPGDVEGLSREVLWLLDDTGRAAALASDAYAAVRADYSQETRAKQIVEVYDDVLRSRRRY